jgi:hypothetical protein
MRHLGAIGACVLCLFWTTEVADSQERPSGTRFSAMVIDAVGTALPAAPAAARRTSLVAAAAKLKPFGTASSELDAIIQLLSASVPATTRCASFMGAIEGPRAPQPSAVSLWSDCETQLRAIASVPATALQRVSDTELRQQLTDVQRLASDGASDIVQAMGRGNWPEVRAKASALNQSLTGILAVAGVELARFKLMTDDLSRWADHPERGTSALRTAMPERRLLQEGKRAIDDARRVISSR